MKRYRRSEVIIALKLAAYYLDRLDQFAPHCKTYYIDAMDDGSVDLEVPCKSQHMLSRIRRVLEFTPGHRKGEEWHRRLGALTISTYLELKEGKDE